MNWLELANIAAATAISTGINSLWVGLLLTAFATGMVRLLPRPNATTRYTVWLTTLVLAVASPMMLWLPRSTPGQTAGPSAVTAPWSVPVMAHWPIYAVAAWLAITAILLARIAWSLVYIHGLKSRAMLLGRRGDIRVMASAEARVPMAAGFVGRAIVFPQSVVDELSAAEFEQVLCHEMAHLRRWDDWAQLAQTFAQAVLFFNPAIYWIGRRLKIEREMACDDWVVSSTGEARPYAACLTHLHELTRRAPAPQLAPGATTRTKWQLRARVEALLQPGRNSTPRLSRSGWMAAGALVSAALTITAMTTPPVGVQEIPLASMAFAQPGAPAAPAITPVVTVAARRPVPSRLRLATSRTPKDEPQAAGAVTDTPVMLVRAWRVQVSPSYFVIAVVFFEPPPATVMHGI